MQSVLSAQNPCCNTFLILYLLHEQWEEEHAGMLQGNQHHPCETKKINK